MTGFLNIDKPEGKSSTYVVNILKHLTKQPCGHLGTLDPFASGVLPVGIGNATRLFDYFLSKKKTYIARFRFGATTDTLDSEGCVTVGGAIPDVAELQSALPSLMGEYEQVPPLYSAKSVGGRRGYELARSGQTVDLPAKRVTIDAFSFLRQTATDEFEFEITCGAGTYIRALARDLAALLGTQAYCTALRRTASGIFTEKTLVPLGSITAETWQKYLIPTDMVLPFPVMRVDDARFYNGVAYEVGVADGTYKIYRGEEFYGTGTVENGMLRAGKKLC